MCKITRYIVLTLVLALQMQFASAQAKRYLGAPSNELADTASAYPLDAIEQSFQTKDTVGSKVINDFEKTVKSSKLTRWLSPAIFAKGNIANTDNGASIAETYAEYNGKIARKVTVVGLDPYAPSSAYPDDDKHSWLTQAADAVHIQTHNFILRNNVMLHKGDVLDNDLLLYNLAYFRKLRYIYDARLIVTPVEETDSVDVEFVLRDVWSIGVDVNSLNFTKSDVELYDRNFSGFGLELRAGAVYERIDGNSYMGYSILQRDDNIKGTFIGNRFEWVETESKKIRHFSVERKVQPNIKNMGGVSYDLTDQDHYFVLLDTLHRLNIKTMDVWGGHAFNLAGEKDFKGQRLVLMARYEYRSLMNNVPMLDKSLYSVYDDANLYIGSISLYKQQYYTDRLLYGFGVNENIPYGYNITFQGGYEQQRFANRFYTSLSAKYGWQHKWGYSYLEAGVAVYPVNGKLTDGLLEIKTQYFSPLMPIGRQALRQFVYTTYVKGINRRVGEGSNLSYTDGVRFDLDQSTRIFCGNSRFSVSSETDLFSTVRLLGFRFVFLGFFDATWLGSNAAIFDNKFYPGMGLGVRIRNDKLVFNTIQITLGWYPKFPQGGISDFVDISGVSKFMTSDFIPEKPAIIPFK